MPDFIQIRNLYKIYNPGANEIRALDGISLEIEQGEFGFGEIHINEYAGLP